MVRCLDTGGNAFVRIYEKKKATIENQGRNPLRIRE